jgi:hypothetical protein
MENCGCNGEYEKDWSKPTFTVFMDTVSSVLVTIYGDMFQFKTLNGLYLSSSNTLIESLTTLDLYSNVKSISAKYPPVTVFPVEEYDVIQNYILQFKMTGEMLNGNYDILYFNDAGYFKASSTKKFTYFTLSGSRLNPIIPTVPVENIIFTDSDDDTYSDSLEILNQTDPTDPTDYPVLLFNVFNNI